MVEFIIIALISFLLLICILGISVLLAAFITGVPFVPTNKPVIAKMMQVAQLKEKQKAYDLGSGLGHILFAAPKNAKRTGYERIIFLVWGSKLLNFWKKDSVKFYKKDFFKVDLSNADVIFCYLFPQIMEQFHKEIWPTLPSGSKVVSNGFPLKPVSPTEIHKVGSSTVYLYIKP